MNNEIRIPKQKRSIEKKELIIDSGWKLIASNGYYNTNTAEIAKQAEVSTGIVYQYFKDKHDILIAGIHKYGDEIFYPMLKLDKNKIDKNNFSGVIKEMIEEYIKDHRISKNAHEEIMSMVHTDKEVAEYYYNREMNLTNQLYENLVSNHMNSSNLKEKVHIIIGMIDNLCHEIVYHQHSQLDYKAMTDIVIGNINNLIAENIEKTVVMK